MNKTIKLVADNPFRVLGIFSNGSLKDLKANASRLNAYMKVGKTVEFPTDLSALMGNVERNADIVTDATSQINLPKDKLKYALFWFAKGNNIDEIAFNNLAGGDMDKAEQLFRKKTTYSSLINRGVLKFIQGDSDSAIQLISQVVYDETYRKDFVSAICDDTFSIEEDELSKMFIDSLLTAFDGNKLYSVFKDINSTASEYLIGISSQTHIDYINNEISKANSAGDDSEAQYEAGLQLMENTKEPLKKLKGIFGVKNFRYQQIADSLSKTILQCGIGYYNETDDDDYVSIDKAMKLQKYATDIAVGGITKERCQKNLAILEKKKKDLPPKEVAEADRVLKGEFFMFKLSDCDNVEDVINFIKRCAPYLVKFKEVLGEDGDLYTQMSTIVASLSLDKIVEIVNALGEDTPYSDVKRIIGQSWNAMQYISKLDYVSDFETRYKTNYDVLHKMVNDVGGLSLFGIGSFYEWTIDLDLRTEEECYKSCESISDYEYYLEKYENGKFSQEAQRILLKLQIEKEDKTFNSCKSSADYLSYTKNYPNGRHFEEAQIQYEIKLGIEDDECFSKCKTDNDYSQYLKDFPKGKHFSEAQSLQKVIDEKNKKREELESELEKTGNLWLGDFVWNDFVDGIGDAVGSSCLGALFKPLLAPLMVAGMAIGLVFYFPYLIVTGIKRLILKHKIANL